MKSKTKALLYVLLCVSLWALIPVVAKLGQRDIDNHQFLFWSSLVSFITLSFATVIVKKTASFRDYKAKDLVNVCILGFLGTYFSYVLIYYGYAHAKGLEVLVLQYSWPLFVVFFSILLLKEKLNIRRGSSLFLGFLAVILILTKGDLSSVDLSNLKVNLLVIVSAVSFGLFSVLSKKIKFEVFSLNTIYFLTATIVSFFSMLVFSEFTLPPKSAILPILVNGMFVNGLSYVIWIKALKLTEASFVAPFVFITPIISAVYLIVFFNAAFLPIYLIGLAAIVVAGILNR